MNRYLRLKALGWLGLFAWLSGCGCGSLGDIYGGQKNLPVAGITPWGKIDFFPTVELIQPFVLLPQEGHELIEPWLMSVNGAYWLFYEDAEIEDHQSVLVHARSTILLIVSTDAFEWNPASAESVLVPDQPWEEGIVGAPAVVKFDDRFAMYYRGGPGSGIGVAFSEDGRAWTKHPGNPVLRPDQEWEGGERGVVTSPSAAMVDGKVLLWYGGGQAGHFWLDKLMGRAIGYAESRDGIHFVKRDAYGREAASDPGAVAPVLAAEKPWEGVDPQVTDSGVVGMPGVFVETSAGRRIFKMYYTGHRIGDFYSDNASVGYAGSFDGIDFVRADDLLNPVVTEKFALTLPGVSDLLDYDEHSATVIRAESTLYLMAYTQVDALDWLSYGLKGIAMAACPPLDQ